MKFVKNRSKNAVRFASGSKAVAESYFITCLRALAEEGAPSVLIVDIEDDLVIFMSVKARDFVQQENFVDILSLTVMKDLELKNQSAAAKLLSTFCPGICT